MNKVTLTKYSDMHQITENISKYGNVLFYVNEYNLYLGRGVTDLNIKYSELLPYLEQVDQIDSSVERSCL